MSKEIIRRYYEELWNRWDESLIDSIISPSITFRGSLGDTVTGRDGFRSYLRKVRSAFPDFHNRIDELIEGEGRVVARLTYTGTHSSGKRIEYPGLAIFEVGGAVITSGWVVGDTLALSRQIEGLVIRPRLSREESERCAAMMCATEPWLTLGRKHEEALALLSDPAREVYLALQDGAIAGFLILHLTGPLGGYLQTVCVAPDSRGGGVGTALVGFAEQRVFATAKNIFLCVSSFNPRARALYERLGYEVIGSLKDYLITGADEILMRKSTGPLRPKA